MQAYLKSTRLKANESDSNDTGDYVSKGMGGPRAVGSVAQMCDGGDVQSAVYKAVVLGPQGWWIPVSLGFLLGAVFVLHAITLWCFTFLSCEPPCPPSPLSPLLPYLWPFAVYLWKAG